MDVDVDMDVHVDKVDEGHGNTDEDMDKVDQWHGYKDKDVDEVAREIGIRMFTLFFIFLRTKATLAVRWLPGGVSSVDGGLTDLPAEAKVCNLADKLRVDQYVPENRDDTSNDAQIVTSELKLNQGRTKLTEQDDQGRWWPAPGTSSRGQNNSWNMAS